MKCARRCAPLYPTNRHAWHEAADCEPLYLVVSIPALNEAATIGNVIRGIPSHIDGISRIDTIVVNDGSTDDTPRIAATEGAILLTHPRPKGVGAAFATALNWAIEHGADFLVTLDGDGHFNPADIPTLVEPVLAGEADFATASRFADPRLVPVMPTVRRWGNHGMSRLISSLAGETFYDVSCGMRCYGRKAMLSLNLLGAFTYTQEVFLNLSFKGMRIVEVPIAVRGEREVGRSRVAGSLWQYALKSVRIIVRAYRDYKPLQFFGGLALALFIPAGLLGLFLLGHYAMTGAFSPHKWAGVASIALSLLGVLLLHMGLLGDMLARHRVYLEELLYYQRRDRFDGGSQERGSRSEHSDVETLQS